MTSQKERLVIADKNRWNMELEEIRPIFIECLKELMGS